jgi:hypothetical protein
MMIMLCDLPQGVAFGIREGVLDCIGWFVRTKVVFQGQIDLRCS